ncbi:protein kinase [Sorangium sp. So ce118]
MAGRYRLRQLLGRGGYSEVWEVDDLVAGEVVAVKLLQQAPELEPARVRREILALRLLRLPGVVRLLDEGIDRGRAFLVMERVEGSPFPGEGRRGSWPAIAGATLALIETIARIHAAGVIHRDLKPENVLVNTEGRPTVLDFGISMGERLGDTLTQPGWVLGTPAYLAPEQILGEPVTTRTDLYALGLLLYHALTGRLPHDGADGHGVLRARLTQRPRPVRALAPDVPHAVAGLVDLLLARAPEQRPRSAAEVLGLLRGEPVAHLAAPAVPRLSGDAAAEALLSAARDRRAVDVIGPGQSGRSRCLREVGERLQQEGARVAWSVPGWRAFSSLEPVVHPLEQCPGRLPDVVALVEAQLQADLAGGLVLLVDDADRLDRWSAAAIERCRAAGAVLRVLPETPDAPPAGDPRVVRLSPLDEAALERLFAGPERLFHLRSDAARVLWVRTEGVQGRVAEEVTGWLRAGLARLDEGGALAVDRDTLDRLQAGLRVLPIPQGAPAETGVLPSHLEELAAWVSMAGAVATPDLLAAAMCCPVWRVEADLEELVVRGAVRRLPDGRVDPCAMTPADQGWSAERRRLAHRAVSQALPAGTPGRLLHLIAGAGGEEDATCAALEIACEAETLARRIAAEGSLGRAVAAVGEGLLALRRGVAAAHPERSASEARLLALSVEIALCEGTPQAYDRVLYELCRAELRTDPLARLEQLVRAAVAFSAGGDRATQLLREIPPFDDSALERHRQGLRVLAARRCSQDVEEAVLEDVAAWASRSGDPATCAKLAGWLGRLRYRQGRFDEAAQLHAEAAELEPWATSRVGAQLNAASALMEAFRHADAAACAEAALRQARDCRHPFYEGRAEWILRSTAYRMDAAAAPDLDLVKAVARLGVADLEGPVCMTEAAIAYRAGDRACAAALAGRAYEVWRSIDSPWCGLLVRALALAAGAAPSDPEELQELAERAARCPVPGLGVQALGLLARARRAPPPPGWKRAALPLTEGVPRRFWPLRMDVLSVEESLECLGVRGDAAPCAAGRARGQRSAQASRRV